MTMIMHQQNIHSNDRLTTGASRIPTHRIRGCDVLAYAFIAIPPIVNNDAACVARTYVIVGAPIRSSLVLQHDWHEFTYKYWYYRTLHLLEHRQVKEH
jgi:hypothetical protein